MGIAHRPECSHAGTDTRHDAYAPCDTLGDGIGIYFANVAAAEADATNPVARLRDTLGDVERSARAALRDVEEARVAMYRLRDAAVQRYAEGREVATEELTWALDRLAQSLDYIEADASEAREVQS
jgi:hypothetical protein